jgi:hypothetical protein
MESGTDTLLENMARSPFDCHSATVAAVRAPVLTVESEIARPTRAFATAEAEFARADCVKHFLPRFAEVSILGDALGTDPGRFASLVSGGPLVLA